MNLHYKIVSEEEIEHKNEYYELSLEDHQSQHKKLYFSTNEENLEEVAHAIIAEQGLEVKDWKVKPHLKH